MALRIIQILLIALLALSACEPRRNPLEPPAPRPDDPLEPRGAISEVEPEWSVRSVVRSS